MSRIDVIKLQQGYVAITIVLVLGAVMLGIVLTVSQLGIGEGQVSEAVSKGESALQFTEGCMEDALLLIQSNASYSGGNITRPEGTCVITVSQAGPVYTVTATSTANNYKRTVQSVVTRSSSLNLSSWKE